MTNQFEKSKASLESNSDVVRVKRNRLKLISWKRTFVVDGCPSNTILEFQNRIEPGKVSGASKKYCRSDLTRFSFSKPPMIIAQSLPEHFLLQSNGIFYGLLSNGV